MACAIRHADKVIFLAQNSVHLVTKMQVKQALPANKETHLVFAVHMLIQKFLAEGLFLGVVRVQADDIRCLEATFLLQRLDLTGIGLKNVVR